MDDTSYDAWNFSSDPISVNSGTVTGTPTYAPSRADVSANSIGSSLASGLSSLLNFKLQQDKITAQTQLATNAARVYPYGVNPLTGLPLQAPASANNNLVLLLVLGAVVLVVLHGAKAV